MIEALVTGKLHGAPQQRTGKSGKPFTVCKLRVPTGEEATFCNVIAFDDATQAALLALGDGEVVALAGSLKAGVWQAKDGTARASLDLTASAALTTHHIRRKRQAMQPEQAAPERPRHDAWRAAAPADRQQHQQYRRGDYAADPGELDDGRPLNF